LALSSLANKYIPTLKEEQREYMQAAEAEATELAALTAPVKLSFASQIYDPGSVNYTKIPPRDFMFAELILGKYISVLQGPGGAGKSVMSIVIAISVALGMELIPGMEVKRARNVLMLNNEDDEDELNRRIEAVCLNYEIDPRRLSERFFVRSGYEHPAVFSKISPDGQVVETEQVEALVEFCLDNRIDFITADPLISLHGSNENDNAEMDGVVKIFRNICARTKAAMMIMAHTRKMGKDSEAGAGDPEAMRGASSLKDGGRITFSLARMSRENAKVRSIPWERANNLVRMDDGKKNLTELDAETKWFRLSGVEVTNGEFVGVPTSFDVEEITKREDDKEEIRMTGEKWAAQIEAVLDDAQRSANQFFYTTIKGRLVETTDYKKSSVADFAGLLSTDSNKPTLVHDDAKVIEYWSEKAGKLTAPWIIHRRVL